MLFIVIRENFYKQIADKMEGLFSLHLRGSERHLEELINEFYNEWLYLILEVSVYNWSEDNKLW